MTLGLGKSLKRGDKLLADGAWGTVLMDRGLKPGDCPERLVLDRGDAVADLAAEYAAAGADLVLTNTFGATPMKLADFGLADQTETINFKAVDLVRGKLGSSVYVVGSVGPTGRILAPYGDADPGDVEASFSVQIDALIRAGVDGVCVETMIDIEESKLAVAAVRRVSAELPILATMTFEDTPRGPFTLMGVSVAQAAAELTARGATAVGANCGLGMRGMKPIVDAFQAASSLPLVIQANAGNPHWRGGGWHTRDHPERFAEEAMSLVSAGVCVIGGCCGTGPAHIAELRRHLDRYLENRTKME